MVDSTTFGTCNILVTTYLISADFTLRVKNNPELIDKLVQSFINEAVKQSQYSLSKLRPCWRHQDVVESISEWYFHPVACRHGAVVVQRRY